MVSKPSWCSSFSHSYSLSIHHTGLTASITVDHFRVALWLVVGAAAGVVEWTMSGESMLRIACCDLLYRSRCRVDSNGRGRALL